MIMQIQHTWPVLQIKTLFKKEILHQCYVENKNLTVDESNKGDSIRELNNSL